MNICSNPVEMLKSPEVRRYFISILQSEFLSQDEKYNRFIEFFELGNRLQNQLLEYGDKLLTDDEAQKNQILSAASKKIGIWHPDQILQETKDSLLRAIRRLKNSQHPDSGWGSQFEISDLWGTVFTVLCLNSAKKVDEFASKFDDSLINDGISWLNKHLDDWSVDNIFEGKGKSIYHISIVVTCYKKLDQESFPEILSFQDRINQCLDVLSGSQNNDGGWDARIWNTYKGSGHSEVGGTSFAIHALMNAKDDKFKQNIREGIQWLINTQNDDGSWNKDSCTPNNEKISGVKSINKTCDALNALMSAVNYHFDLKNFEESINKANHWILSQQKLILEYPNIPGWGWIDPSVGTILENTCLTLETLLKLYSLEKNKDIEIKDQQDYISLPLLTNNARWLMKHQYKEATSKEDGNWRDEQTARIALALINYYRIIKDDPLFHPSNQKD